MSAAVLDPQRLRKQRAEVIQLLQALENPKDRLYRHPACKMWWGFKDALATYGIIICDEIISRGENDNSREKILAFRKQENPPMPKWLGNSAFHASHRGNLLKKDYKWYSVFGWTDSPLLPYIWPVNHDPRLFR